MGYCIHMTDQQFEIPARHIEAALGAICKATPTYEKQDTIKSIQKNIKDYNSLSALSRLREIILRGWGFLLKINDDSGDVIGAIWEWEKLQSGTINWMKAVAPFIAAGNYLEFAGGDGDKWRYVFNGQTAKQVRPKIIW